MLFYDILCICFKDRLDVLAIEQLYCPFSEAGSNVQQVVQRLPQVNADKISCLALFQLCNASKHSS